MAGFALLMHAFRSFLLSVNNLDFRVRRFDVVEYFQARVDLSQFNESDRVSEVAAEYGYIPPRRVVGHISS